MRPKNQREERAGKQTEQTPPLFFGETAQELRARVLTLSQSLDAISHRALTAELLDGLAQNLSAMARHAALVGTAMGEALTQAQQQIAHAHVILIECGRTRAYYRAVQTCQRSLDQALACWRECQ